MILLLISSLMGSVLMSVLFEFIFEPLQLRWELPNKKWCAIVWWCSLAVVAFLTSPLQWIAYLPGVVIALSHIDLSDRFDKRVSTGQVLRNVLPIMKWHLAKLLRDEEGLE